MIPLLITVFIDSLGFGLVFPIFSPLIVGNETGFFAPEVSLATRGLLFGMLVSTYCVGLFFGGPFLGALSDRKGRKKILVASLFVALVGYLLAYGGVLWKSAVLLFFARFLNGLAAGNYGVVQSIVADTSSEKERGKNFGLIGMAWGSGFIIGPFLGGKWAAFGYEVPFIAAAAACVVNLSLLVWKLKETLVVKQLSKLSLGLSQIKKAFQPGPVRGIFAVMFIFSLGWGFFTEFSPIFLMRRLDFSLDWIANYYAWVGIWIALCQGWLIRSLIKKFAPEFLLRWALLGMGLILPVMLLCGSVLGIFALLPFVAFAESFISPTSTTIISNLSPKDQQGEMLGIHNSVQSAAIGLSPLFSGSLVALYPHLPATVGSLCMLASFGALLWVGRKAPARSETP